MEVLKSRFVWIVVSVACLAVAAVPFFSFSAIDADFHPGRANSVAKFLVSVAVTVAVVVAVLMVVAFVRLLASHQGRVWLDKPKLPVPLWAKIATLSGALACVGVIYVYFTYFASRRKKGFFSSLASKGSKARELHGPTVTHFDWIDPLVAAGLILLLLFVTTLLVRGRQRQALGPGFERAEHQAEGENLDWDGLISQAANDSDYPRAVQRCWFIACAVLAKRGEVRHPEETPSQFSRRVGSQDQSATEGFFELTTLFNLARFSRQSVDQACAGRALFLAEQMVREDRFIGV